MTDWRDADFARTRAGDRALPDARDAVPVVLRTDQGDRPAGDTTMWGVEQTLRTVVVGLGNPSVQNFRSQQLVRAQVSDNRARKWNWRIQLTATIIEVGEDVNPNVDLIELHWAMGVGTTMLGVRENILAMAAASSEIWIPEVTSTTLTINIAPGLLAQSFVGGIPGLTDPRPMAEACAPTLMLGLSNSGTDDLVLEWRIIMFLCPDDPS